MSETVRELPSLQKKKEKEKRRGGGGGARSCTRVLDVHGQGILPSSIISLKYIPESVSHTHTHTRTHTGEGGR